MKNLRNIAFLFFVFVNAQTLFAQNYNIACDKILNCSDCNKALPIFGSGEYNFSCLPKGNGDILEISNNSNKSKYFAKEHNTVWLKFKAEHTALFSLKLIPNNLEYDLDFALFKLDTNNYCENIRSKKLEPIRANNCRNDKSIQSKTGTSLQAENEFIPAGPGENYSKVIQVKKGDSLLLVIDNVYYGQEGFTLILDYLKTKTISGIIKDENTGEPISSDLTWENANTGELLTSATNNDSTGKFEFEAPVYIDKRDAKYILVSKAPNYFFNEIIFTAADIADSNVIKHINVVLPKLKKGNKIQLHSINFYGDKDICLPSATATLKRLYKIMKKNPKLNIEIEGHTNGCSSGETFSQILSDNRAKRIKLYLTDKKIDASRISTIGYNCSRMLYPNMETEHKQMLNRRVEILVTSY